MVQVLHGDVTSMGNEEVIGVDKPLRVQFHETAQRFELAGVPVTAHLHDLRVVVIDAAAPLV